MKLCPWVAAVATAGLRHTWVQTEVDVVERVAVVDGVSRFIGLVRMYNKIIILFNSSDLKSAVL